MCLSLLHFVRPEMLKFSKNAADKQHFMYIWLIQLYYNADIYECVYVFVTVPARACGSSICLPKLIKGKWAAVTSMDVFLMMLAEVNMQNAARVTIS